MPFPRRWKRTFTFRPIIKNETLTVAEKALKIAEYLRSVTTDQDSLRLEDIIDNFEAFGDDKLTDVDEFDMILSDLWDYCDSYDIWVKT